VQTPAKQITVTGKTEVLVGLREREGERIQRATFLLRAKGP